MVHREDACALLVHVLLSWNLLHCLEPNNAFVCFVLDVDLALRVRVHALGEDVLQPCANGANLHVADAI
eukprot:10963229-Prorocentrum_lima.AAC.1